jgi:hypothetical protein
MKRMLQVGAAVSLSVCILSAVAAFLGAIEIDAYKEWLLAGTVGWFVFATAALSSRRS